jgi:hypothetical protein
MRYDRCMDRRLLRGIVLLATLLGVAAAVLAFVPAVEVYEDGGDCFGHALASLFALDGAAGRCESAWVYVGTRTAAEHPAQMAAYFLVVIAPGLVVWRRPRPALALAWTIAVVIATFVMVVVTFELFGDWGVRTVALAPARLYGGAASALLVLLIVILPVACAVLAIAGRRRPHLPELPEARALR